MSSAGFSQLQGFESSLWAAMSASGSVTSDSGREFFMKNPLTFFICIDSFLT